MKTAIAILLTANVALAGAGPGDSFTRADNPARLTVASVDTAALNAKIRWHEAFDRFDPGMPPLDFSVPLYDDHGAGNADTRPPAGAGSLRDTQGRFRNVAHASPKVVTGRASSTEAAFPEPGNWAVVLAGILGAGAIARRRVRS